MTTREAEIIGLIHKEVKPALGCTEPIAVALAAARATELLAEKAGHACRTDVDFKVNVEVSGNILKNGMGVGIPGTGMIGLRIAAALGTVCGKSAYGLEVLKDLEDKTIARAKELVAAGNVTIGITDNGHKLYVKTTVSDGNHSAYAVVEDEHDNIVETSVDGNVSGKQSSAAGAQECGKSTKEYGLTVKEIFDFAESAAYEDIKFILEDRTLNLALAEEGLKGEYGLKVGKTIMANSEDVFGKDFLSFAMALTAAASDARMAGCTLPAMSNSGSGNQGITVSMPVIATH